MACVINTFNNSTRQPGSAASSQDVEAACPMFSLVTIRSYIIVFPRIGCREGFISLTRNKWLTHIGTSTAQCFCLVYQSVFIDQCVFVTANCRGNLKNLSFVIDIRLRLSCMEFNSSRFEAYRGQRNRERRNLCGSVVSLCVCVYVSCVCLIAQWLRTCSCVYMYMRHA